MSTDIPCNPFGTEQSAGGLGPGILEADGGEAELHVQEMCAPLIKYEEVQSMTSTYHEREATSDHGETAKTSSRRGPRSFGLAGWSGRFRPGWRTEVLVEVSEDEMGGLD